MKILIVAATSFELDTVSTEKLKLENLDEKIQLDYLQAGIGMTSTAYQLTKRLLSDHYDLAINIGVAGSFSKEIKLGEVVEIESDQFSELGAEDGEAFLSLSDMKLAGENDFPFKENKIYADAIQSSGLRKVSGITVNTVHGNKSSISKVQQQFQAQIESMEGAAFLYVCRMEKLPCIQLRSISNYVEKRNKENWKMKEALHNLSIEVINYLKML